MVELFGKSFTRTSHEIYVIRLVVAVLKEPEPELRTHFQFTLFISKVRVYHLYIVEIRCLQAKPKKVKKKMSLYNIFIL